MQKTQCHSEKSSDLSIKNSTPKSIGHTVGTRLFFLDISITPITAQQPTGSKRCIKSVGMSRVMSEIKKYITRINADANSKRAAVYANGESCDKVLLLYDILSTQ
jgi:hypothetical protein